MGRICFGYKILIMCLFLSMKKSMLVNGVHVHLQSGLRNGAPVVACTLNYGAHHPLHFIQVDRPMSSMKAADAYITHADHFVCRSILSRLSRSEEKVIAGVNRVFGASDAEASIAYAKLERNSHVNRTQRTAGGRK